MNLSCSSRIVSVTVHARGAVVARRVELPKDLPAAACELCVPGLPALAGAGSLRAEVEGERSVVALRSRLVLPEAVAEPEGIEARLRELEARAQRVTLEQTQLQERRGGLLDLEPRLRGLRREGVDPAARARDALAANALVTDLASAIDARLRELADGLRELGREREALRLERQQARAAERGRPTREVAVRLAPRTAGPLEQLTVRYVVPTARWWPAYAARLTDGGRQAEWSLEAFVAQTSGEDWEGVELSLSTADLIRDARLPELRSLRLGRAQPERPSGFRPPPAGLDTLFAGYDRDLPAATAAPPPQPRPKPVLKSELAPEPTVSRAPAPARDAMPAEEPVAELAADEDDWMEVEGRVEAKKSKRRSISFANTKTGGLAPGAAPAAVGGGGGGRGSGPADKEAPAPAPIEPADAWLDFDGLVLGPSEDRARRGRLVRVTEDALAGVLRDAEAALQGIDPPRGARDPLADRGQFDHLYRAEGRVDVDSRAEAQRVALSTCAVGCRPLLRVVAGVEPTAYREVELTNPLPGPLLAGPIDVFLEGSLLTTSSIRKVGRGGPVQLGLGVEERVRVARNVRTAESTAGLIGKTTAVEHTVTTELASSLKHPVQVEVIDRVPVTDDEDVSVELVRATPEGDPYDQRERDQRVRGGRRWLLELPGGGEARIELVYRVSFPSRRELVGGNRRD